MKNETKSPNTSQTNVQNSQLKVFEQNANYDSEVLSLDIKDVESQEPFNIHFEKEQKLNDSDVQCVCCGAVLSEDFAIWFRHRYYCCKECLPEETSRGYRLVCYNISLNKKGTLLYLNFEAEIIGGIGYLICTWKILIKVGYFYLGSRERNLIQYLIRFLFM